LALKKGAIGSRLTGAGWGGCTVSMVEESKANDFMQAMIDDYYMKRPELKDKIVELGIENVVF
jgi:galactokinase